MKSPLIRLKYRGVVVIDCNDPALVSQRHSRGFSQMRARLTKCYSEIISYASGSLPTQGPLLDLQFLNLSQINLRDPCDFLCLNDLRLRARGQLLEGAFSSDDLCAVRPGRANARTSCGSAATADCRSLSHMTPKSALTNPGSRDSTFNSSSNGARRSTGQIGGAGASTVRPVRKSMRAAAPPAHSGPPVRSWAALDEYPANDQPHRPPAASAEVGSPNTHQSTGRARPAGREAAIRAGGACHRSRSLSVQAPPRCSAPARQPSIMR